MHGEFKAGFVKFVKKLINVPQFTSFIILEGDFIALHMWCISFFTVKLYF